LYPNGTTFTPSTSPLTTTSQGASSSEVELLTCQSNRFVDNSSNAFAITRNGDVKVTPFSPFAPTAAYDASVNGGSGYFDGSGDYLTITDTSNDLDLGGADASLDLWFYTSDITSTSIPFGKGGGANSYSTSNGNEYLLLITGGSFYFYYNNGGTSLNISSSAIRANSWNHVVVATNASNAISLFINGSRVATATNAISKPTTRTTVHIADSVITGEELVGYISNVRHITGANAYDPTDTTITIPAAPPTNVSGTELLCNFTNAGIFDQTGKNNLETVADAQIDTSVKKYGTGSMEFDGTGDWLLIPSGDHLAFGTGDYTVECFVYFNSISTTVLQIFFCSGTNVNSFFFHADGNQLSVGTSAAFISNQATTFSTGTWYHVAACRSGTTLRLFKDGVQVGSDATDTTNWISAGLARVGANPIDEQTVNGFIDDLRITKGVARYTSAFTPPTKAFPDL
jgi:hypothetical protein